MIKVGAAAGREDATLVSLKCVLVSLNGDGHWLLLDCRLLYPVTVAFGMTAVKEDLQVPSRAVYG